MKLLLAALILISSCSSAAKTYAQANIDIKAQFHPLQKSLELSNAGISDGEIARISEITDFSPNLVKVPIAIFSVEAVAFSKNLELNINHWDDLKGHHLTIVKGAKFIETGTNHLPRSFALTLAEAFDQLEQGHTEIIVLPRLAALKIRHEKKLYQIKQIGQVLEKLELYPFHLKMHVSARLETSIFEARNFGASHSS